MVTYKQIVKTILENIFTTQTTRIIEAVRLGMEAKKSGGHFYILGTGHSHMMAEEFYDRLKGADIYDPILMPELMLHQYPNKSTYIERTAAYADVISALYPLHKEDVLMLISNSGRNGMMVEMADIAKRNGAKVITVTNYEQAKVIPSRHPNGRNIIDYGDINISNCGHFGDCAYVTKGGVYCGATSTITTTMIAQMMNVIAISEQKGHQADCELINCFKEYYYAAFDRVDSTDFSAMVDLLFDAYINDRDIYIVGSGHSHLMAEELYIRAGGMAMFRAILEDELMNHQGAQKSDMIEMIPDYASLIYKKYQIKKDDVIIICSNSGKGAFSNELAVLCRQNGVKIIAITNKRSSAVSLHPSGKLLKDNCDLLIDNCVDPKDAAFMIDEDTCAPLSSSIVSYILETAVCLLADKMETNGIEPPIFTSANIDQKDSRRNDQIKERFRDKYLYQPERTI